MQEICNCYVCRRYRKYLYHLERVPNEDREFWEDIFTQLYSAEEDASYFASIKVPKLQAEIERMQEALRAAEQFIENGVEFGYIIMPDSPDPALNTLPMIKQALQNKEGE